jgi:hypothetical protein
MRRHLRELVDTLGRRELALIAIGSLISAVITKAVDVLF